MTAAERLGKLRKMPPRLGLLALLLALPSCTGGTEAGNPKFEGALSYTGISSSPEDYAIKAPGAVASIESAWLDLAAVEISAEGACEGDGQTVTIQGLGVGDHAAGAHVETAFEARPGTFCSFSLPFERAARVPDGAPEELTGHSILLLGELADGTPFRLVSDAVPLLHLEAEAGGFELTNTRANVLVAFDFAAWLGAVPLSEAAREGDAIRIDSEHNAELLAAFDQALASGVALYRDANADGKLDEDAELLARAR